MSGDLNFYEVSGDSQTDGKSDHVYHVMQDPFTRVPGDDAEEQFGYTIVRDSVKRSQERIPSVGGTPGLLDPSV